MKEIAEKLFFQYKKGDLAHYSKETLLYLADEYPKYEKYILVKQKSFLTFLDDLPPYLFSYYHQMLDCYHSYDILGEKKIKEKVLTLNSHAETERLVTDLNQTIWVNSAHPLGGNSMLVSLYKSNSKYNYVYDYFIYMDKKINITELNNAFRKEVRKKDHTYEKNKEHFIHSIKEFEEKNRLRLLFVS